jgi:pyruvate/2-oxoglutarate dehydrogenase complex dihydrolipoamide acyltransferase (E2) component
MPVIVATAMRMLVHMVSGRNGQGRHGRAIPEKPMNASDMIPAVTRAMAVIVATAVAMLIHMIQAAAGSKVGFTGAPSRKTP